jgi:hypothetical protein
MTLTFDERRWLEDEAQETFGLTLPRTRILRAVLDQQEPFSIRSIAREVNQGPEAVRLALEMLVARELIDLQATGSLRGPKAACRVTPGRRLRMLFGALRGQLTLEPPTAADAEKKARTA